METRGITVQIAEQSFDMPLMCPVAELTDENAEMYGAAVAQLIKTVIREKNAAATEA